MIPALNLKRFEYVTLVAEAKALPEQMKLRRSDRMYFDRESGLLYLIASRIPWPFYRPRDSED